MRLITRFISHSFLAVLEGLLIATLVVGLIAGSALAAKGGNRGGGGGGGSVTGSCSVAPDPVAPGDLYTVSAWGLRSDTVYNVNVWDSQGVQSVFGGTDANGRFTAQAYAYWSGTNTVKVMTQGRKASMAATCSFQVTD